MSLQVGPRGATDGSFGGGAGVASATGVAQDGPDGCLVWVAAPGGLVHPVPPLVAVTLLVCVGGHCAAQDESGGFDGLKWGGGEVDAVYEGNVVQHFGKQGLAFAAAGDRLCEGWWVVWAPHGAPG
eukprot:7908320-Pyramimonas_sp.AAC.1